MKLWQKTYNTNQLIETFTVGRDRELDVILAPYDVLGSLAHTKMLSEVGLMTADEYNAVCAALKGIYRKIQSGDFIIAEGVEDVHSQVEFLLTQSLGDIGKKIHAARSRNDQVLVDLRLYLRAEIKAITEGVSELFETLMQQSQKYKNVLMPGYTHLQIAMPSSFGLWFGAYAETLVDDLQLMQGIHAIINQNPLGSAAGYGSSLPINRTRTTDLLGFSDLNYNVVHAQMGRGKSEHFMAFGLAALGHTLAKLAMDVCLYMSQNFDFVTLPSALTTGSSIMPHKKNPDVFELIRARCNRLQSLPAEVALLTSNLPSGYHRDFQLLKEIIFPAIESIKSCLSIATFSLGQIIVKNDILDDDKYQYLFSVEEVNRLVLTGIPFREAYKIVSQSIENQAFRATEKISHTHEGSIGNLNHKEIKFKMKKVLRGYHFDAWRDKENALLG